MFNDAGRIPTTAFDSKQQTIIVNRLSSTLVTKLHETHSIKFTHYIPSSKALPAKKGTLYHVCDVKGRHHLIKWWLTKLNAHARSSTSVFKPNIQSSFQVNVALACYLCLCSQRYIVVQIELVDFLTQWQQLEQ